MYKYFFFVICLCLSACHSKPSQPSLEPISAEPIRGVWLTNVDSEALFSKAGIEEAVAYCAEQGFNTIFTVTWNRGYTLYPSAIMEDKFGRSIDPKLAGRDPLQELITAAKAKGIKVFAWFEFGFSSSYEEEDGGYLLRKNPNWAAIDSSGNIVSKNRFQWMNAFDPKVQDFILSLLEEVVEKYEIAGIQGDDRLPALPSEAGYDRQTLSRFQTETGFAGIPAQFAPQWIDWRSQQLNLFMQRMHQSLKAINPNTIISVSPSIYPWSKQQYLQDWPTWVKEGWVDMVCPQIYRYDIQKYRHELQKIVTQQLDSSQLNLLAPGILLKVGDYIASDTLLQQMVAENRKYGIEGEVFFFYEGLRKRPVFFDQLYR